MLMYIAMYILCIMYFVFPEINWLIDWRQVLLYLFHDT